MSQKYSFSSEEDEKLIDLVRLHPALYVVKRRSYKDCEVKNNNWKIIAEKMVEACKGRWKSIRDYYQRKRKGAKKGTGTAGDNGDNFYTKFKHLRFLENTSFVERKSQSNVEQDDNDTDEQSEKNEETPYDAEGQNAEPLDVEESQNMEDYHDIQESHDLPVHPKAVDEHGAEKDSITPAEKDIATPLGRKRARLNNKNEIFEEIKKGRTERTALLRELVNKQTTSSDDSDTATSMFFRSIATTVSAFSPQLKTKAKLEVMKIISQLELENISLQNRPFTQVSEIVYVQDNSLHSRPSSNEDSHGLLTESYMTTPDNNVYELL